jgi:hypothetical protein
MQQWGIAAEIWREHQRMEAEDQVGRGDHDTHRQQVGFSGHALLGAPRQFDRQDGAGKPPEPEAVGIRESDQVVCRERQVHQPEAGAGAEERGSHPPHGRILRRSAAGPVDESPQHG